MCFYYVNEFFNLQKIYSFAYAPVWIRYIDTVFWTVFVCKIGFCSKTIFILFLRQARTSKIFFLSITLIAIKTYKCLRLTPLWFYLIFYSFLAILCWIVFDFISLLLFFSFSICFFLMIYFLYRIWILIVSFVNQKCLKISPQNPDVKKCIQKIFEWDDALKMLGCFVVGTRISWYPSQ